MRFRSPPISTPLGSRQDDEEDISDSDRAGGWSHKREVVVERPRIPVVQYAVSRYGGQPMGGVQGLWWYVKSLFVDPDGDVANQFFDGDGVAIGGEGVEGVSKGVAVGDHRRALVEVAGVSRGNVELKPATLD